ncbi:MAG TPA: molybdenum cofactor biosynthesis protein MoaE [Sphingomicrobium sp.]|jgi:molybdopterin synthase catalytic subunit|nr:molybdenum cofactor biosynthesis protein MoaE [Sphingomicrobium sp.]
MIRVEAKPFDPAAELVRFSAESEGAGAIVSFVGVVRGGDTKRLELSHYAGFTDSVVETLAADARAQFAVSALTIVHRVGALAPGEPIVFVAAAAAHRRAAFDAIDYLMDRLKTDAPFWKKEVGAAGERWVEPRPEDRVDRSRWERESADAGRN